MLAAMQVLKSAGAAAYFANQDLLAVMTFKGVQLSTRYGKWLRSPQFGMRFMG